MNKELQYFERTGLFMHGGETHGCEQWHVIGLCNDHEFHKFADTVTSWRKEHDLPPIKVEVVREWFKKFMDGRK